MGKPEGRTSRVPEGGAQAGGALEDSSALRASLRLLGASMGTQGKCLPARTDVAGGRSAPPSAETHPCLLCPASAPGSLTATSGAGRCPT